MAHGDERDRKGDARDDAVPRDRAAEPSSDPETKPEVAPADKAPPPEMSAEWSELISRFGHGRDSALHELIEREAPRLLRKIDAALPDKMRARVGASDIFQQTLLDLVRVQERFEDRGTAAFRAMMQAMAEARIARAVRRERAQKRDVLREVGPPKGFGEQGSVDEPGGAAAWEAVKGSVDSPSQEVRRKESGELLQEALEKLSEADRTIIRLIDYDEIGYAAAADQLGIEVKAAQKRHARAIARLRGAMGEGS